MERRPQFIPPCLAKRKEESVPSTCPFSISPPSMADAADFVPAKKKSSDEAEKRKKLTPGSLMKALVRSGAGDANPSDGDQLIFHCTTRTVEGAVVNSTRSEYGGKGKHLRLVLGKSKMILGFAEGFPTMLKG